MFLSRAPLTEQAPRVRLACIRHAASVRPEPGSNSSLYGLECHRSDVRTKRNGSGTCASSRFSCEGTGLPFSRCRGRIKNQGSASGEAAGTGLAGAFLRGTVILLPPRQCFTTRRPSSHTRRGCVRLSPIAQYSPLLPPVGVWTVSQFQCG